MNNLIMLPGQAAELHALREEVKGLRSVLTEVYCHLQNPDEFNELWHDGDRSEMNHTLCTMIANAESVLRSAIPEAMRERLDDKMEAELEKLLKLHRERKAALAGKNLDFRTFGTEAE